MLLKPNIKSLFEKKRAIEAKIEQIQKECKHTKTHIKLTQKHAFGGTYRVTCEECEKVLRYPTQEEMKKFLLK
tara:strand:+ start:1484 stop:1702 length:219 start_codon:yes stop_codon:yes gene_type:complete